VEVDLRRALLETRSGSRALMVARIVRADLVILGAVDKARSTRRVLSTRPRGRRSSRSRWPSPTMGKLWRLALLRSCEPPEHLPKADVDGPGSS
jgi:hypothetical protein